MNFHQLQLKPESMEENTEKLEFVIESEINWNINK